MTANETVAESAALAWAKRVNGAWIVHNELDARAAAWLAYLQETADDRLELSCRAARWMCDRRERTDDPKPWFYAGLFSLATAAEARRFLEMYRVTMAAVPAMAADETMHAWLRGVSQETRDLVARLRRALRGISNDAAS